MFIIFWRIMEVEWKNHVALKPPEGHSQTCKSRHEPWKKWGKKNLLFCARWNYILSISL